MVTELMGLAKLPDAGPDRADVADGGYTYPPMHCIDKPHHPSRYSWRNFIARLDMWGTCTLLLLLLLLLLPLLLRAVRRHQCVMFFGAGLPGTTSVYR